MKKFLIAVLIALVVLIGGGAYWYLNQQATVQYDPVEAIPTSASLVVRYPHFPTSWEAFERLDYSEALSREALGLQPFFNCLGLLDSLIRSNEKLENVFGETEFWMSHQVDDNDSLQAFLCASTGGINSDAALALLKKTAETFGMISESVQHGIPLVTVTDTVSNVQIFLVVKDGLVLVASQKELLTESLIQLQTENSLLVQPEFKQSLAASGQNVEANVFINYDRLPAYLQASMGSEDSTNADAYAGLASWTELDMNLRKDGLSLNGFSYCNDTSDHYLNLFVDQEPQLISFPEILPATTTSFLFFGIGDPMVFATDRQDLSQALSGLDGQPIAQHGSGGTAPSRLEQNMLAWIGNVFGICRTNSGSSDDRYLIFKARSGRLASKLLSDLSESGGQLVTESESADRDEIEIRQLLDSGMLAAMIGPRFDDLRNPYYVVMQDHVIMSASATSLVNYIRSIQADRTLAKDLAFTQFAQGLGSSFNIFSYDRLQGSKRNTASTFADKLMDAVSPDHKLAQHFEAIGTQLSSTDGSFYTNVFVRYNPNWSKGDEKSWTAEMTAGVAMAPMFVKNHLTGEPEILVQDAKNTLYLFNRQGQDLFSVELPEPVLSRPTQVDAFKNGNLQYLFNTNQFIYLIDRNGKVVDGYPVRLEARAVTPLSVINYDNNRNYRLLIACDNKRVYNYDISGRAIPGWRHNQAPDQTIQPFQHLSVSGKDYLITGETNGKIHLLDRRGKNRVRVKKRITPSANNRIQVFGPSEKAFNGVYLTDPNGTIHRVSLDGNVQEMNAGRFSPEHQFLVADLNGNGTPEFIFSDLNKLHVFNYKKEKIFEHRLDPSALAAFIVELEGDQHGIGLCYQDSEQLILFDSNGEMVEGFPLSGTSAFDILRTNQEWLVVSSATDSSLLIQSVR